jgi:hypothetical protein
MLVSHNIHNNNLHNVVIVKSKSYSKLQKQAIFGCCSIFGLIGIILMIFYTR